MLSWGDSPGPRSSTVKRSAAELERCRRPRRCGWGTCAREATPHRTSGRRISSLSGVVAADHGIDAGGRDHRHLIRPDELDDAAVVVRVGMRDEHRQERLAEGLELRAESTAVGDGERAVDRDDSLVRSRRDRR